jgi:dihydroneopterin aldolase
MAEPRVRRATPKPAPVGAEAHAGVFDRVFMHDLVLDVEIGVYTHEKGVTQRVRFSVDVDLMPATGALNDDIGRAFDYDTIVKGTKDIVARGHINLVETLAERIARHCLAHPRAARVWVKIEKLDKEPGAVGVEIVRAKGSN